MIRGGFKPIRDNDGSVHNKLNNETVHVMVCTSDVNNFIRKQQKHYAGHVGRLPIEHCDKQLTFNDDKYHTIGRVTPSLLEEVLKFNNSTINIFINNSMKR